MEPNTSYTTHPKPEALNSYAVLLQLVPPAFKRVYGLREVFKKGSAEQVIKYEISITYLKTIAPGLRIFEVSRVSPIYINDSTPDTVAEELAIRCGAVFYPLQVYADFTGKYAGLHNPEEIKDRWPALRNDLESFFTGDYATAYLNAMENTLAETHLIEKAIAGDLIVNSFFQSIYLEYKNENEVYLEASFPVAGYAAPVEFGIRQRVKPVYNESDQIEVIRNGKATDHRAIADLLSGDDFGSARDLDETLPAVDGTYTARYALNRDTRSIEAMEAEWTLMLEEEEMVKISAYELKQEIIEKEPVPVKKSFLF